MTVKFSLIFFCFCTCFGVFLEMSLNSNGPLCRWKGALCACLLPVREVEFLHSNTLIFAPKSNNFCAQKRQYLHSKTQKLHVHTGYPPWNLHCKPWKIAPKSCVFAPGVTHWGSSGGTRWGTQTYKHMARKIDLTGRPNALIRGCDPIFASRLFLVSFDV